jgi:hypothetical protein
VLILDMIEVLPPMGIYKYDAQRILLVKCYIDNSMHLRSCIRNVNTPLGLTESDAELNALKAMVGNAVAFFYSGESSRAPPRC